jgi:putative FmdB family regulatory protein
VPIYEYRCGDCETSFEVLQRMSDDPLVTCEKCGGHLRKVLHPVAIHFKGSGFYTTDYGKGSGRRTGGDDSSSSSDPASSGSSSSDSAGTGGDAKSGGAADKPANAGGKAKEKQKAT